MKQPLLAKAFPKLSDHSKNRRRCESDQMIFFDVPTQSLNQGDEGNPSEQLESCTGTQGLDRRMHQKLSDLVGLSLQPH